ncbi:MAG: histidinol-phosphate transaminase [Gammaproteobacteria bacterium]
MIEPQAHVAALAAYSLAELKAPPGKRLVSLAQNESCMPPSPKALAAAGKAIASWQLYPDPDWTELRAAIAGVHDIAPETILCGAGSMELIGALMRCYAGPGTGVLSTQYAYAFFRTATLAVGGDYSWVEERDYTINVDAILEAVRPHTRVVCVANPGNPTGTRISNDEIVRLRAELPEDMLLVVDEAYGEFANDPADQIFGLAERGDTVILRTFSKVYGLAGARVGWGVFPSAVAEHVRKLLNPNNISTASQAASAAAMLDRDYMRAVRRETIARRDRFSEQVKGLGLNAIPSSTNFVLIEFSTVNTAKDAAEALREEGILMRGMAGYGLPHCLRATISHAADMNLAVRVLSRLSGRESI